VFKSEYQQRKETSMQNHFRAEHIRYYISCCKNAYSLLYSEAEEKLTTANRIMDAAYYAAMDAASDAYTPPDESDYDADYPPTDEQAAYNTAVDRAFSEYKAAKTAAKDEYYRVVYPAMAVLREQIGDARFAQDNPRFDIADLPLIPYD
jgi:hypothetical protein